MRVEAAGLQLDFSRQRLDESALDALLALAADCGLSQGITQLLGGAELNNSEQRPAWHSALRAEPPPPSVAEAIRGERARMRAFVDAVHSGRCCNADGEAYTDVINIGIGGSDLGPRLVDHALHRAESPLRAHFVGNLDSAHLDRLLAGLDARRCLCVVVSKSFTTDETMRCAKRVREWLSGHGGDVARQCIAVSARPQLANDFGIVNEQIFTMWDWVGGRYSLWSAVGLSIALALGWSVFEDLLAGAGAMDSHFGQAPLDRNLPVLWGLIATVWRHCPTGCSSSIWRAMASRSAGTERSCPTPAVRCSGAGWGPMSSTPSSSCFIRVMHTRWTLSCPCRCPARMPKCSVLCSAMPWPSPRL